MDLEDQWAIKKVIQRHGTDDLIVIIGCPDAECAESHAETVIAGDPSFAGPLTGVQLGLPVYHVMEAEIKSQIPQNAYQEHLREFEPAFDEEEFSQLMKSIRTRTRKGNFRG
jgi:glycine/sarcosine/betaine reductase complex component A